MRWCFLLSDHRTNSGGWDDGDEWCCLCPRLFLPHLLMSLHLLDLAVEEEYVVVLLVLVEVDVVTRDPDTSGLQEVKICR